MKPFTQHIRQVFIDDRLTHVGHVSRAVIQHAFGVNGVTASSDLQAFLKAFPERMVYNESRKQYFAALRRPVYSKDKREAVRRLVTVFGPVRP